MRLITVSLLIAASAAAQTAGRPAVRSHITTIDIHGKGKRVVLSVDRLFEAPNWSPDGKYLLLNSQGRLWRMAPEGGQPQPVDTGAVKGINNDHGISADGKWFAISAGQMYVLPSAGGTPRQVTKLTPSYFHGWSPDGRTLVYCASRGSNFDLYGIPAEGGEEKRLTMHAGYDDGPDYSPGGKWIYFNSDRSGSWDIWRIPATGAGPDDARAERITSDDYEDWFPHPSPDGKWLVLISFAKGTKGHPANQNVILRRMRMPSAAAKAKPGKVAEVVRLFGGQGTLNVNSWAPKGNRFAYVSYELIGSAPAAR